MLAEDGWWGCDMKVRTLMDGDQKKFKQMRQEYMLLTFGAIHFGHHGSRRVRPSLALHVVVMM